MSERMTVNGTEYVIIKLLGKGKGGYSYLAEKEEKQYVLKQIHHEPCEYYTFGDKIAAEQGDYQRLLDAASQFQTGQRILVKILEVERKNHDVRVLASVKQATENPYEKALRKYSIGNKYVGTVSLVDTNGVFVALDGEIDCLCAYPKRGRPPRGARATVRIIGINYEANRIWGAITHISAPR